MAKKRKNRSCGIGGQAVLEGVMMKNKEEYAVAIRKPNGEIDVEVDIFRGSIPDSKLKKIPFIRGIFNFVDSLVLGTKLINYSASFYEDEDAKETGFDRFLNKAFGSRAESILMGATTVISVVIALAIFLWLPMFLVGFIERYSRNASLTAIIEGLLRIAIFLLYVVAISLMKDIHRLYQYHGAEHKCINCIEKGRPLTKQNVMRSSRLHKRCGTSFMFFVIFVSIIVFFFIRVDNTFYKLLLRIAFVPLIAGISYEIIRLAGRSDNFLVKILSAPGMLIQRLTTKEPEEEMIEVAIKSVEAIFDWKVYLFEEFGYEVDSSWLDEEDKKPDTAEEKIPEEVMQEEMTADRIVAEDVIADVETAEDEAGGNGMEQS